MSLKGLSTAPFSEHMDISDTVKLVTVMVMGTSLVNAVVILAPMKTTAKNT